MRGGSYQHAGHGFGLSRSIRPHDVGEQVTRDGDLGHLERDVAPVISTFASCSE